MIIIYWCTYLPNQIFFDQKNLQKSNDRFSSIVEEYIIYLHNINIKKKLNMKYLPNSTEKRIPNGKAQVHDQLLSKAD